MLEELPRGNYSIDTICGYVHAVEQFAAWFNKSPELLGPRRSASFNWRRDLDFENLPLLRTVHLARSA